MKHFWSLNRKGQLVGLALLTATAFACGGEDGLDGGEGAAALVETSDASAEECEYGGVVITTGLDADGDGVLNENEIVSTAVICDGAPGAGGEDGETGETGPEGDAGADGDSSLVVFEEEPAGANCPEGGVRVLSGLDTNSDGTLQESEVVSTDYVCNLSCSPEDYAIELGASDAGDVVYNGFDRVTFPATTSNTGLTPGALLATPGFEFELEFDATEGLVVSPTAGEGKLDILVAFTDGCGFIAEAVSISNIADGESTIYLGHFFGGAGEVDLNLAGTDERVATFDFTDILEPAVFASGAYAFDALVGDDVAGTTPELIFAPEKTYIAFAYSDAGELAFGFQEVDTTEPGEGKFHARFNHLVDGVGTVDVYLIGELDQTGALGLDFGVSSAFTPLDISDDYIVVDATGDLNPDLEYPATEGLFAQPGIFDVFLFQTTVQDLLVVLNYSTGEVTTFFDDLDVEVSDGVEPAVNHTGAYPSVEGFVSHGNGETAVPGDSGYREFTVPGASAVRLFLTYQIENCCDALIITDLESGEEVATLSGPSGAFTGSSLVATATVDVPSNRFSIGVRSDGSVNWAGWRIDGMLLIP